MNKFLPQWVYELLRWVISVIMPAIAAFIAAMNGYWSWNLPIDAILGTFAAIETLLGAIFLGSKYANDAEQEKGQE